MFCMYCGKELPDNAQFCAFCGNKISIPRNENSKNKPTPALQLQQESLATSSDIVNVSEGKESVEKEILPDKKKNVTEKYKDVVPDYAFYIFSLIHPTLKRGVIHCIVHESDISPYLDYIMKNSIFDVVKTGEHYIVTMNAKTYFGMCADLGLDYSDEDIKKIFLIPKYRTLAILQKNLENFEGKSAQIAIFARGKDDIVVVKGISYLGIYATLEEVVPLFRKYNFGIKCGADIISPDEALNIYRSKNARVNEILKANATCTGTLIEIVKL